MSERLIGLENHPVARLIGVGETQKLMTSKCVLEVAGQDTKEACGTDQIFQGMEAGIEGGIHYLKLMCK